MKKGTTDYLELHFLVVIWSLTGILGMLIKISPPEVVFYRCLFATILLALILWLIKEDFVVSWTDFSRLLAAGFLFAGHWILFFASARVSNISICLSGMATMALWTSIIEPLFEKGKISALNVVLSMVAAVGIAIIYQVELDMAPGLLLALLSALMGAASMVINKHLVRRIKPFKIMFYEMLVACILALAFVLVFSKSTMDNFVLMIPDKFDLMYLFILAGLCTVYAYTMSIKLMKRLTAFKISFAINLEPVYGIILALLIFGEREYMNIGFYLGSALILLAVSSYPHLERMRNAKILKN